jgi:hypothetical protein
MLVHIDLYMLYVKWYVGFILASESCVVISIIRKLDPLDITWDDL